MKKIIAVGLVLIMVLSMCACGQNQKKNEFDPREEFKSKVDAAVAAKCILSYADVKTAITTLSDIDVNGDTYTGKGKVTIKDNYGDTYVGKVTAVYKYDEASKTFTKVSLDIDTPKKQ